MLADVTGRQRWFPRLTLVGIVLGAWSYHFWQASKRVTPWIFPDENRYAAYARAVAETGIPRVRGETAWLESLQSYLTAPSWFIDDVATAHRVSQAISVLAVCLTAIPVYLLARRLAPTTISLLAAAGSVMIPAAYYGSTFMQESFALPIVATAAFFTFRLLERFTWANAAGLVATCLVALVTRGQLVVLPAIALLAFALDRAARFARTSRSRAIWVCTGAGVALAVLLTVLHTRDVIRLEAGVRSAAAAAVAVAVVPAVALVSSTGAVGRLDRAQAAFAAVAGAFLFILILYAARKAAAVPIWLTQVEERNAIYLEPLAFVALAGVAGRVGARLAIAGSAVVVAGIAALRMPEVATSPILTENPGLSWLFHIPTLGVFDASITPVLFALAIVGGLLMMRRAATGVLLAVCATLAGIAGSYAYRGDHGAAASLDQLWLQPSRDWVDREAGSRKVVALVTPAITDLAGLQLLHFWNRRLRDYTSAVGGSSPAIAGPHMTFDPGSGTFPAAAGGLALHADDVIVAGQQIGPGGTLGLVLTSIDVAETTRRTDFRDPRGVVGAHLVGRYRDGWVGGDLVINELLYGASDDHPIKVTVDTTNGIIQSPRRVIATRGSLRKVWTVRPNEIRVLELPVDSTHRKVRLRFSPLVVAGPTDPRTVSLQVRDIRLPDFGGLS